MTLRITYSNLDNGRILVEVPLPDLNYIEVLCDYFSNSVIKIGNVTYKPVLIETVKILM